MAFKIELGPSSSTAITLYPEWDYEFQTAQNRSDMRTPAGKLFSYKYGDYKQWDLDLKFVPSSTAEIVNSWYDTNTRLLYFVSSATDPSSFVTETYSVVIRNDSSPFNTFQEPNTGLWNGGVALETY